MSRLSHIEIDIPVIVKSPENQELGNREKVEYICRTADDIEFKGLLVGFVDREFREFNLNSSIHDNLEFHNKVGRVIWSRGHSVENYLFDFSILREGLRDFGVNSNYLIQEAIDLFEINFDIIISIACAISLAAKQNDLVQVAASSLDCSIFEFKDDKIQVNLEKWNNFLSSKMKLDPLRRTSLIDSLSYYLEITNVSNLQILRWLCHGHIGINFIWSAFEACRIRTCEIKEIPQEQRRIRKINNRDRFIRFSSTWIQQQIDKPNRFQNMPLQCFQILGVPTKSKSL